MNIKLRSAGKRLGLGLLNVALAIVLYSVVQAMVHGRVPVLGLSIIAAVILAAAYLAGGRWIERRRITEFVGSGGIMEFAAGVGLGILLFSAVIAALWAAGAYRPMGWGTSAVLGAGVVAVLSDAIVEEVLFRGFLFRLVETVAGTWGALLLTSALFGAAHAMNPGATAVTSVAIAVEAGLLLGAAYALKGRLWLPIGLHASWNFSEGYLFGMSVSGFAGKNALIRGSLSGPAILTGGAFGPEASLIAVGVCLSATAFLLWRVIRLGRVQPPAWHPGREQREGCVSG